LNPFDFVLISLLSLSANCVALCDSSSSSSLLLGYRVFCFLLLFICLDLLTILSTSTNSAIALLAVYIITRKGRRFLLLVSSGGMLLAMLLLSILFAVDYSTPSAISSDALTVWGTIMVLSAVGSFEFGLGPIPWLVSAEIFPASQRTSGMAICVAVNWTCSFLVGVAFPHMDQHMHGSVGIPFIVCLLLLTAFIYYRVHETGDKSLEAIQEEYTHLRANENTRNSALCHPPKQHNHQIPIADSSNDIVESQSHLYSKNVYGTATNM
jgi:hypothetical protein